MKVWPCKIGTIPSCVILCRNYKPRIGLKMLVRDDGHGSRPFKVIVTEVQHKGSENGQALVSYFKAARI